MNEQVRELITKIDNLTDRICALRKDENSFWECLISSTFSFIGGAKLTLSKYGEWAVEIPFDEAWIIKKPEDNLTDVLPKFLANIYIAVEEILAKIPDDIEDNEDAIFEYFGKSEMQIYCLEILKDRMETAIKLLTA